LPSDRIEGEGIKIDVEGYLSNKYLSFFTSIESLLKYVRAKEDGVI